MIDFNLTRAEFFARCFEINFHYQKDALRDVDFGWKEINEWLYLMDPGGRGVRLFQNGPVEEGVFIEHYTELGITRRRIIKEALYRIMGEGGTLVMNRLELVSSRVRRLCMSVSALCGSPSIANGYVAFDGEGSFGKHWDTHDVFAVQLFGRKHWTIYPPTFPLPMRGQTSRDVKASCPETPVFDAVLETGDVLYVPRGWWHEARPMGEATCHLAIGTHGPTLSDYATWCCQKYLRDHLACRRSARLDDADRNDLNGLAEVLGSVVADPLMFEEFQRDTLLHERMATPFDLEHFIDPRGHPLGDDTELLLSSNWRAAVDRRYLPVNGVAPPRDPCARLILERLAAGSSMTIARMAAEWPHLALDDIRAAARMLLSGNRALIRIHTSTQ